MRLSVPLVSCRASRARFDIVIRCLCLGLSLSPAVGTWHRFGTWTPAFVLVSLIFPLLFLRRYSVGFGDRPRLAKIVCHQTSLPHRTALVLLCKKICLGFLEWVPLPGVARYQPLWYSGRGRSASVPTRLHLPGSDPARDRVPRSGGGDGHPLRLPF